MTIIDWLLAALIAAGVCLAVRHMKKKKGCSCGCQSCCENCSAKRSS